MALYTDLERPNPELSTVDFETICKQTNEFLTEYFDGAIVLEGNITFSDLTQISYDGLASFIAKVFAYVFKLQLFTFNVANCEGDMILKISWNDDSRLTETQMRTLRAISKTSGFGASFYDNSILIRFYAKQVDAMPLYASTLELLVNAYIKAFPKKNWIFK